MPTDMFMKIGLQAVTRSAQIHIVGVSVDGESKEKNIKWGKEPREKVKPGGWCGNPKETRRCSCCFFSQF